MRPEVLFSLFAPVTNLNGVGPKLGAALNKRGLPRLVDLIFHLPDRGIERVEPAGSLRAYVGRYPILRGVVGPHARGGSRSAPYRVRFDHALGSVDLVFFHAQPKYLESQLPIDEGRIISGKLEEFGDQLQIAHPDFIAKHIDEIPKFEPLYPLGEGITQRQIAKAVVGALGHLPALPEWQRHDVVEKHELPSWGDAISAAHTPRDPKDIDPHHPTRLRLALDELLSHQLTLAIARARRKAPRGRQIVIRDDQIGRARAALPFTLTGAQQRAIDDIFADFISEKRMFRLVQGDVGSGKTAVAFLAMMAMVNAGLQCAMVAPTEILARQHAKTLQGWFDAVGVKMVVLTGSDKTANRRESLAALASGDAMVAIGTHALFQDAVEYRNLGLAVIDEQHRFGVRERKRLTDKGAGVDTLSLSATPIPRSLSMAIHGEMDISILDEKPPGRKPIETSILSASKLDALGDRVEKAIMAGRQIYWVVPLVNESEVLDLTHIDKRFGSLVERLGADKVAMVHGQQDSTDKEAQMQRFVNGEAKVLVATTVIEVGVDVPNASIMVIEGAERFGLSQLHQLRGRVGRGSEASFCILVYGDHLGETARERLELMRESDDGFKIAEADLALRGAGDFIGTAQSGLPIFKIADLDVHRDLLAIARDDARFIVDSDPLLQSPRGEALRILLYLTERDQSIALLGRV